MLNITWELFEYFTFHKINILPPTVSDGMTFCVIFSLNNFDPVRLNDVTYFVDKYATIVYMNNILNYMNYNIKTFTLNTMSTVHFFGPKTIIVM